MKKETKYSFTLDSTADSLFQRSVSLLSSVLCLIVQSRVSRQPPSSWVVFTGNYRICFLPALCVCLLLASFVDSLCLLSNFLSFFVGCFCRRRLVLSLAGSVCVCIVRWLTSLLLKLRFFPGQSHFPCNQVSKIMKTRIKYEVSVNYIHMQRRLYSQYIQESWKHEEEIKLTV